MPAQLHDDRRLAGDLAERILDQLPVALCVTDEHGSYCYSNRACDVLLGGEPGEKITDGRTCRVDTAEEYPLDELPTRRALQRGGVIVDDRVAFDRPGAPPVMLEVVAAPIRDPRGATTNAVAALRNLGEQRDVERERAVLSAVVDSTDDAVITIDRSGRITSWNGGAVTMYGYSAGEALGAPITMLSPAGEDRTTSLTRLLDAPRVAHREVRRTRKDGSIVTVGETAAPVRAPDGSVIGVGSIARDVSARLETERALALTRAELELRNRHLERSNAELEQFAYVASHDLSEPLRAVAGMVGLLARRYEGRLDSDADEFIAYAVDGCERMRQMIEDLLALSRVGRAELRLADVDVNEIAAAVVTALGPQIEEAAATVHLAELPVVAGDRARLAQLLQNLVSNAVKFRRPDVPAVIEVSARPDGRDAWRFEVTDNGIGIEERYRERVFRMFQRLHTAEVYPGTGIGLAIAERIVERHGGTIGVEGSPSGGSRFWFRLPRSQQESDR